ncbi:MAG: hypothetical protein M3Q36_00310, partial [bacterium]|nr:hypothetical protein [bacterium]
MVIEPIQAAVLLGITSIGLELLSALVRMKSVRLIGYAGVLLMAGSSGVLLFMLFPGIPTFIICLIAFYRVLNAIRVLSARMHPLRNLYVTRRTSLHLVAYQLVMVTVYLVGEWLQLDHD